MPIEELELSVRAYNCLKRAGITKVGEVLERLEKGEDEILAIRNFGRKSLDELVEKSGRQGLPGGDLLPAQALLPRSTKMASPRTRALAEVGSYAMRHRVAGRKLGRNAASATRCGAA